ncbi:MAG: DUF188 domain-containing protein [Candidatus Micrarchaeia archaeon]
MARIIIDTSSLLFGMRFNKSVVDIAKESFPDYELLIPKAVISELLQISSNRGNRGAEARAILSILGYKNITDKNNNVKVHKHNQEYADKWILSNAAAEDIVVTNDTKLLVKLLSSHIRVLRVSIDGKLR